MEIFESLRVSARGMAIEKKRMEIAALNLSNIDNTRTAAGGPYQRQKLVVKSQGYLNSAFPAPNPDGTSPGFEIVKINSPPKMVYEPSHPDADSSGYVAYPDINVIDEMIETIAAARAYEANLTAFNETKSIFSKALEIGKV